MSIERVNIRVYGLLLHAGRVLVSDELVLGRRITKFPGGGLELGEGTKESLLRELDEELGVEATDLRHFYTTDYFQLSAFRPNEQIISIYYTFAVADPEALPVHGRPFGGISGVHDQESFRWLDLASATVEDVTLPIDQVVLAQLIGTK